MRPCAVALATPALTQPPLTVSVWVRARAAFLSKELEVDGSAVKFQIWDTAGQEKVRAQESRPRASTLACVFV